MFAVIVFFLILCYIDCRNLLEKLESIEEVVYDKTEFDNRTEAIRHGYLDYILGYFMCFSSLCINGKSVNELCNE